MASRRPRRQKRPTSRKQAPAKKRTVQKPDRRRVESGAAVPGGSRGSRLSGRRKWLFRLAALTVVPAVFFLLVKLGLRVIGYGYPASFFVKIDGRDAYTTNQRFGWQFFPPAIARAPEVCELPAKKVPEAYRVFVLGRRDRIDRIEVHRLGGGTDVVGGPEDRLPAGNLSPAVGCDVGPSYDHRDDLVAGAGREGGRSDLRNWGRGSDDDHLAVPTVPPGCYNITYVCMLVRAQMFP